MTLHWTLISFLMWVEIGCFLFLCLPLPTSIRHKLAKVVTNSTGIEHVKKGGAAIFVMISILFLDSIREMNKMSTELSHHHHDTLGAETQLHMRLFRSQRNAYISGFTMLLLLVLNRYVSMMLELGNVLVIQAQAKSQQKEYERVLDDCTKNEKTAAAATSELEAVKAKLDKADRAFENLKKQSEGTTREYMRLIDEHAKLQAKFEHSDEAKKDK